MQHNSSNLPAIYVPWWRQLWMYLFIKNKLIELGYIKKEV